VIGSGLALQAAANVTLAALGATGRIELVLAAAVLCGAAHMLVNVASTLMLTSALEHGDQGLAAGLLNSAQQLGTGLSVAAVGALASTAAAGAEPSFAAPRSGMLGAAVIAAAGVAVVASPSGRRPHGWLGRRLRSIR
jgi:hypothetical protein